MKLLQKGTVLIAKMQEDIDHSNAILLRKKIDEKIKTRDITKLVFDFSDLEFMDSSGIGMILGRYKIMQSLGGKVYISDANENVMKIINISGLHKIIPVYDTKDEAEFELYEVKNNEF